MEGCKYDWFYLLVRLESRPSRYYLHSRSTALNFDRGRKGFFESHPRYKKVIPDGVQILNVKIMTTIPVKIFMAFFKEFGF